jgi:vancomycin resistance protein YoaR
MESHPALDVCYRRRNTAKDNRIKSELLDDPETMNLIRKHHEEDEKLYRYASDVIFPRQVEQFGSTLEAEVSALEKSLPAPQKAIFARAAASLKRNVFYKRSARRAKAA